MKYQSSLAKQIRKDAHAIADSFWKSVEDLRNGVQKIRNSACSTKREIRS
jgi:hypothetical protein